MTDRQAAREPAEPVSGRQWAGSWLGGLRPADASEAYPGEALGLPADGPDSVASMSRHLLALVIDWFSCMLISYAAFRSAYWTLPVFAAETWLLTSLTGLTVGKRLAGIRVVRLNGGPVGFGWALLRTVLLLTVVPPLVTDRDLRGLHDRAANTVVVRI